MKESLVYFSIFPKIVPSGQETNITIKPLFDHCRLKNNAKYEVTYNPMESLGIKYDYCQKTWNDDIKKEIIPIDDILKVSFNFEGEQEHVLEITEVVDDKRKKYCSFSVYSVKEDLFTLRPYKGDMHLHSKRSDGTEAPAFVAAACRKTGFDFMAVTDHSKYFASIEAQKAFEVVDIDLKIFAGEEVHPPKNNIHMINFGGSFSVNELFKDEEKYQQEVHDIKETVSGNLSEEEKYDYASSAWCFDKIREGGGIGIFCHPYWAFFNRYNVSARLNEFMFEKQPFDAYELISGFDLHEVESNKLQVAYYNEERSKGRKIPIVGVSDAHGCERGNLFSWYYTIIFSQGLELADIKKSIKDLQSVAVEALPGETVRVHGPLKLVKFALFLIREVFPKHDEICFEEGKLMLEYLSGKDKAADTLKSLKGQCRNLMEQYWTPGEYLLWDVY